MPTRISRIETQERRKGTPDPNAPDRKVRPLLETATGTGTSRQQAKSQDEDLEAARADAALDQAAMGVPQDAGKGIDSGYDETEDGLSDIEETTREQAEDRATGDDKGYKP